MYRNLRSSKKHAKFRWAHALLSRKAAIPISIGVGGLSPFYTFRRSYWRMRHARSHLACWHWLADAQPQESQIWPARCSNQGIKGWFENLSHTSKVAQHWRSIYASTEPGYLLLTSQVESRGHLLNPWWQRTHLSGQDTSTGEWCSSQAACLQFLHPPRSCVCISILSRPQMR